MASNSTANTLIAAIAVVLVTILVLWFMRMYFGGDTADRDVNLFEGQVNIPAEVVPGGSNGNGGSDGAADTGSYGQ